MKVEIITYWTLDEYLQIEAATFKSAKSVSVVEGRNVTEIDGSAIPESNKIAMTLAVQKMTTAEGTDVPVNYEALGALHATDGLLIREEVEKVEGDVKKK